MVLMDKGNIQTSVPEEEVALYETKGFVKYELKKSKKAQEENKNTQENKAQEENIGQN